MPACAISSAPTGVRRSEAPGDRFQFRYLQAFFLANFYLGVLGRERFQYWYTLLWTLARRPRMFSTTVYLAILGYHYRKICRRFVPARRGYMSGTAGTTGTATRKPARRGHSSRRTPRRVVQGDTPARLVGRINVRMAAGGFGDPTEDFGKSGCRRR